MVELVDRTVRIDGSERLVLAGEVHYFRLHPDDWADRLDALVAAGANAVASYIPWLVHERPDATIDLSGVGEFIDMAAQRGLWFIARPGPFVMAELKNEGLPYRLYREHPEIVPTGWDGVPAPSRTVDYLAPAFLAEVDRWYAAVIPLLALRRNVIAVQLDNEVGMLAWVTNSPDLTPLACVEFAAWARAGDRESHYPYLDAPDRDEQLRAAAQGTGPALRRDLPLFSRQRFARYLDELRTCARRHGHRPEVPFLVNIHGTSDGRADTFPIGISQLVESYRDRADTVPGSDHYIGDLTSANIASLYVANAFLDASAGTQPTACLEFEAGSGDYGQDRAVQHDPSAVELKTRLCVAQGNRMINYYLFSGGTNRLLDEPVGDGDDRIAFTGERHGFAAPVDPEGVRMPAFDAVRRAITAVSVLGDRLARMREEHDPVALGFVLDHYANEYRHPTTGPELTDALTHQRGGGPRGVLARAMLLAGFRFGATIGPPDPSTVLALAPTPYLDGAAQQELVAFLRADGRMLAFGALPVFDLDGAPCTVLVDELGLKPAGVRRGSHDYFPTVSMDGRPDVRVGTAQLFTGPAATAVERGSGLACGIDTGSVIALTCDYICDVEWFGAALARLGATPGIARSGTDPGVLVTSTADTDGDRLLHLINPTGLPAALSFHEGGAPLFGGEVIEVGPRSGLLLPLRLGVLDYATAEIAAFDAGAVRLRADGVVSVRGEVRRVAAGEAVRLA